MYWKCTVCGYIHTGAAPPDKCPVCGADRTRFVEVDATGALVEAPVAADPEPSQKSAPPEKTQATASQRQWKCTVCGYIHTGAAPPEKCPACGADRSLFIESISQDADATAADPVPKSPAPQSVPSPARRYYDMITELMVRQHAHPISVHIPNGVAPIGVLFLFLAVIFQSPSLEIAATCNLVAVLLAMPFVIFSGVNDWKKRFGGNMTNLFLTKIICGGLITGLLLILVLWRAMNPSVASTPGALRMLYLLLHAVVIGAAALAGYMGGKLVFPTR